MIEVVAALIWDKGRFLICQRPACKARALLWEFPGGKTEPGESREAALVRESQEELAVNLVVGRMFMDVVHEYSDVTVHLSLFNSVISAGRLRLLEHKSMRWITAADIPQYQFCPSDEKILEKLTENDYNHISKYKEELSQYDK